MGLSLPHLLVIALIVFLLFGANRFPNMMGDLAKGIKSFKQGLKDEDDEKSVTKSGPKVLPKDDTIDHIDHTPDRT
jgi:sec-independent protein translocase protein TatA